jgi:hypothetical protein
MNGNGDLLNRIHSLETWKEDMQVEMVNRLLEQIANRMDMNLNMYLPKVALFGQDLKILQAKFA